MGAARATREELGRRLHAPVLSLISDDALSADALVAAVEAACGAAQLLVQLRAPNVAGAGLLDTARRLLACTKAHGCSLLVNDRIDVALGAGADGAHLPARGMASAHARALLGDTKLLGRSVHSLAEIERERDLGAVDYVQFGPVFATPSKAAYGPPQGLEMLARAVNCAGSLPLLGVGGVDASNARAAIEAGASGVAVIRAIMRALDPAAATRELIDALRSV